LAYFSRRSFRARFFHATSAAMTRTLLTLAFALSLGCSVAPAEEEIHAVDEDAEDERAAEALTGSVAVGTTLTTIADLNLRSAPATSSSVLRVMAEGTNVTVAESAPNNGFYRVKAGASTGWASGKYLRTASTAFSCTGTWGTTQPSDKKYFITAFGCWVDSSGVRPGDSGDNCIPGCLSQLQKAGACSSGLTGKQCEEKLTWFTADAGRFGCGARVKITNPANGKSAVAIAIDYGPACWVERQQKTPLLDASGRVNRYLFGEDKGVSDRASVTVEVVSSTTPLGPA
jgi:hypothetical protein